MDLNKIVSEFILEEFVPAATLPANKFALGVLAGAGGVFGFGNVNTAAELMCPEQLEALIRAGFAAQPRLTIRIADFLAEDTIKKYPVLALPIIQNVLRTPYEVDLEAAERLIAKLKS
jgi:hypothetical protein